MNPLKYIFILIIFSSCTNSSIEKENSQVKDPIKSISELSSKIATGDTVNLHERLESYLILNFKNNDSIISVVNLLISDNIRQYKLARIYLNQFNKQQKTDLSLYLTAHLLQKEEKVDSSILYLRQAYNIKQDPIYLDNIVYFYSLNEPEKALNEVALALEKFPNHTLFYLRKANILVQLRKYNEAIEYYNLIEKHLNIKEVYSGRAQAYNEINDPINALKDINKAIQMGDTTNLSFCVRASAYYTVYKYDHALEDINKSIQLNKDYASAFFIRGLIYKEQKKYELALNDIEEAKRLDSTDIRYFGVKARILQQMKKYDESEKYYKIANDKGDTAYLKFYRELLVEKNQ